MRHLVIDWLRMLGESEERELEVPKENSWSHIFKTNECFLSIGNEEMAAQDYAISMEET